MLRSALRVEVSKKDQQELKELLRGGVEQVRVLRGGIAATGRRHGAPQIAEVLPLTRQSVRNLAHRYQEGGLDRALYDRQRPGTEALLVTFRRKKASWEGRQGWFEGGSGSETPI